MTPKVNKKKSVLWKDPIQSLVSSTTRRRQAPSSKDAPTNTSTTNSASCSYLVLLQHGIQGPQHVMTTSTSTQMEDSDISLYRRANIRTPLENAIRDASGHLWFQHLLQAYQNQSQTRILWLQTLGKSRSFLLDEGNCSNVTILDLATNPFGWDESEDDSVLSMENLETLVVSIEQHIVSLQSFNQQEETSSDKALTVVLAIESLAPFLMRHGFSRLRQFLERLCLLHSALVPDSILVLVLPVLIESLSSVQHQALEDMAQAVLTLQQGNMTLIRQGVRERGNVLREQVPFQLVQGKSKAILQIGPEADEDDENGDLIEMGEEETAGATANVVPPKPDAGRGRPGKVTLKMEEEDIPIASKEEAVNVSGPRIYLQDDDPEFDDHDEDDDLDF